MANPNGVYVGNLDWNISEEELKDHMQKAGDVKVCDAPKNPKGRSKGYGIVEYASAADAKNAIDTLDNTQLGERLIFVREDREGGGEKGKGKGKGDRKGGKGYDDRGKGKGYDDKGKGKGGKGSLQVGPEDEGRVLFVGNLTFEASWQDVKDQFSYVGKVQRVEIAGGKGKSKGWGRVLMEEKRDAQKAIDDLHDTEFQGRNLVVRMDTKLY